jgi:hypothetical protein
MNRREGNNHEQGKPESAHETIRVAQHQAAGNGLGPAANPTAIGNRQFL